MTIQKPLLPGLYRIASIIFLVYPNGDYVRFDTGEVVTAMVPHIQAEGFEIEIIRLTNEPDKEAELLYPHPTNDQPLERSWYVEEYVTEDMDELEF